MSKNYVVEWQKKEPELDSYGRIILYRPTVSADKLDSFIKDLESKGTKYEIHELAEPTQSELNRVEIEKIKQQLTDWDYKTSKHADGEYTESEWNQIVAQRRAWRKRINDLGGNV